MKTRKNEAKWDGKRWRIQVQRDGERKSFQSTTPGTRGKIEAERKADAWLTSTTVSSSSRLSDLWQRWLDYMTASVGDHNPSYLQREQYGKRYILPILGFKRADTLTESDWQSCIDRAFRDRGLHKKTLENIRGCITAFCRWCRKSRISIDRPEDLTIPRAAVKGERTILQPDELRTLFAEDSILHFGKPTHCWLIHAWRFQVLTGLRPGEISGLKWTDLNGSTLTICRSWNTDDILTAGKNANSNRRIQLPPRAAQELSEQQELLKAAGVISEWMFPQPDGAHTPERISYKRWLTYRTQHGIKSSLYELRHTMVSVAYDVPDALLKPIVGHSASMDTRGVYSHELDGQRAEAASAIQTAFDNVLLMPKTKITQS